MIKNKAYIGVSFIILIFGILVVPNIVQRCKENDTVKADRLNVVNKAAVKQSDLFTVGKAPEFKFINQDGKPISDRDYDGKVYVVEFFFTTCPTICPKMNANLLKVQQAFFGNKNFGIASITIDPEHDTAKVLKEHRDALGIESDNWHFLTGDKTVIYDLANKGFKVYAGENKAVAGGFEHSGYFALIDKKGYIRCRLDDFGNPSVYYDGIEAEGVTALTEDIKLLLAE